MSMNDRSPRSNSNGNGRTREVVVDVPKEACGFIVGKGGRNIKELQRMDGIRYINVDFEVGSVKIVGNDEGMRVAQRRIDQAVCLAANTSGYFPEKTMTCLRLNGDIQTMIEFQATSSIDDENVGGVQLEQLDKQRKYFVICLTVDDDVGGREGNVEAAPDPNEERIFVGYNEDKCVHFLEDCIRQNIDAITGQYACTEIGVNFGKTFLSSVPEVAQGTSLSPAVLGAMKYGKNGMRPEFVRHFSPGCHDSLLNELLNDYVPLSFGKLAVVHCVSQLAKKKYTIKLQYRNTDGEDDTKTTQATMRELSQATTYFEVLGVHNSPDITSRQVELAYQKMMILVHPNSNNHGQSGQAMELLNEARATLKDDDAREKYSRWSVSRQRPRNHFHFVEGIDHSEPLPDVQLFRSKVRKLGLLNVLGDKCQSEFRTTIEIEKDETSMNQSMRQKLQEAWNDRSDDGKFRFPDGTDDWLIVETIRYKQSEKYGNDAFEVTIDKTTEEYFGKSIEGVNVSLKSTAVEDSVALLASTEILSEKEDSVSNLLSFVRLLQIEAGRISLLLDKEA